MLFILLNLLPAEPLAQFEPGLYRRFSPPTIAKTARSNDLALANTYVEYLAQGMQLCPDEIKQYDNGTLGLYEDGARRYVVFVAAIMGTYQEFVLKARVLVDLLVQHVLNVGCPAAQANSVPPVSVVQARYTDPWPGQIDGERDDDDDDGLRGGGRRMPPVRVDFLRSGQRELYEQYINAGVSAEEAWKLSVAEENQEFRAAAAGPQDRRMMCTTDDEEVLTKQQSRRVEKLMEKGKDFYEAVQLALQKDSHQRERVSGRDTRPAMAAAAPQGRSSATNVVASAELLPLGGRVMNDNERALWILFKEQHRDLAIEDVIASFDAQRGYVGKPQKTAEQIDREKQERDTRKKEEAIRDQEERAALFAKLLVDLESTTQAVLERIGGLSRYDSDRDIDLLISKMQNQIALPDEDAHHEENIRIAAEILMWASSSVGKAYKIKELDESGNEEERKKRILTLCFGSYAGLKAYNGIMMIDDDID